MCHQPLQTNKLGSFFARFPQDCPQLMIDSNNSCHPEKNSALIFDNIYPNTDLMSHITVTNMKMLSVKVAYFECARPIVYNYRTFQDIENQDPQ